MSNDYPEQAEQEMLQSANGWIIFISLFAALLLNLLPLQGILLFLRPDFVALIILFWSIHQPQRMGMSIAFGMGLLVDVSNASILGQHAMAYCVIVYFALILHRRIRIFNPLQQIPQIGLILLFMQFIILLTGLLGGSSFPSWHFFLTSVTGMLTWPLIYFALRILKKPKIDPNAL